MQVGNPKQLRFSHWQWEGNHHKTREPLMIFKRAVCTTEVGIAHKDASQHVKAVTSLKVTRKELFRCY